MKATKELYKNLNYWKLLEKFQYKVLKLLKKIGNVHQIYVPHMMELNPNDAINERTFAHTTQ